MRRDTTNWEIPSNKQKTYIHYGHSQYEPVKLSRRSGDWRNDKPEGLWASPTDARWGWKEWCESEGFRPERLHVNFRFSLKPEARVLHVYSLDDVFPKYMKAADQMGVLVWYRLVLENIYEDYDAMELHLSDNYTELRDNNVFYTWDVDSICVWNPDVVEAL